MIEEPSFVESIFMYYEENCKYPAWQETSWLCFGLNEMVADEIDEEKYHDLVYSFCTFDTNLFAEFLRDLSEIISKRDENDERLRHLGAIWSTLPDMRKDPMDYDKCKENTPESIKKYRKNCSKY